jgi:VWFA-related protein
MSLLASRRPSLLPAVAVALLAPLALLAQTPTPAPAGSTAAPAGQPITLPVTVVDGHGDPVKNLTAADLTLTDNGQVQTIGSFAVIAQPSPAVFGILAETSSGLRTELGDIRLATTHFIDHTLPGVSDKVFLVQFGHEVDLLADPTTAQNTLHDAVDQIGSREFGQNGTSDTGSESGDDTSHSAHSTGATLNDALYLSAMEVMKKQPGQHVIVLISSGVDSDSKESINDAIEAAQAARTMIFAIYYKPEEEQQNPNRGQNRHSGVSGPGFPGGGGGGYPGGGGGYPGGGGRRGGGEQAPPSQPRVDGKAILEHLCSATGGYMVEGRKDKADEAFAKISALLKYQYALTWTPSADAGNTNLHHITLSVSKKKDVWALAQEDFSTKQ